LQPNYFHSDLSYGMELAGGSTAYISDTLYSYEHIPITLRPKGFLKVFVFREFLSNLEKELGKTPINLAK
jgi:hypothetical protein